MRLVFERLDAEQIPPEAHLLDALNTNAPEVEHDNEIRDWIIQRAAELRREWASQETQGHLA